MLLLVLLNAPLPPWGDKSTAQIAVKQSTAWSKFFIHIRKLPSVTRREGNGSWPKETCPQWLRDCKTLDLQASESHFQAVKCELWEVSWRKPGCTLCSGPDLCQAAPPSAVKEQVLEQPGGEEGLKSSFWHGCGTLRRGKDSFQGSQPSWSRGSAAAHLDLH